MSHLKSRFSSVVSLLGILLVVILNNNNNNRSKKIVSWMCFSKDGHDKDLQRTGAQLANLKKTKTPTIPSPGYA
jgi:hypothetical protein